MSRSREEMEDCEVKLINKDKKGKSSEVWNYFGNLFVKGVALEPDHYFCILCVEKVGRLAVK